MNERSLPQKEGTGKGWLPEIPPSISKKDAAYLLSKHVRSIERMIQEGVFHASKVGGSTRLSSKEVLDYLKGKGLPV